MGALHCVRFVWRLDIANIRCCIFTEIKHSATERRNPREASCRAQHQYPEAQSQEVPPSTSAAYDNQRLRW